MATVKLIETGNDAVPDSPTSNSNTPIALTPEPTISFELEDGGEAIFRVPTVRDIKLVEKQSKQFEKQNKQLSLTDTCRELGKVCLQSWGDRTDLPDDDEMDAADDQELVRLFLKQLAGVTEDLNDEEMISLYVGQSDRPLEQKYEVLSDKSHKVTLSCGSLTLRRLTRKDIKRIEGNAGKVGSITGDVLMAASVCVTWWRSDRDIMPSDFDPIPLSEFGRVSEALKGFLKRSSNPN